MTKSILPYLAMTIFAAANYAYADHPSFGFGGASGGINTTSAQTLPAGQWAVQSRLELIDNNAFSDTELESFETAGIEDVHSTDDVLSAGIGLAYGISKNSMVTFYLPYVRRNNIRAAEPLAMTLGDTAGIGDAIVQVQHIFSEGAGHSFSAFTGVKLPTGKTTENSDEGERHELEFQPGSGSWDPLVGIAVSWQTVVAIDASLSYIFATDGKQHTNLGDIADYDLSFAYRLTDSHGHSEIDPAHTDSYWDVMLEFNGESREKTHHDGSDGEHSGGTIVYLSPGIKYSTSKGFAAYLSLGFPLLETLNGQQSEPDYRVIAGVSWAY